MLIGQALGLILSGSGAVNAFVNGRIYEPVLPQKVAAGSTQYPAIAYRQNDDEHVDLLHSPMSALTKTEYVIFSVSKGPGNLSEARRLNQAIRDLLEGFQGTVTDGTVSPVETLEVQGIFPGTSRDAYDDQTQTHQVITQYEIWAA